MRSGASRCAPRLSSPALLASARKVAGGRPGWAMGQEARGGAREVAGERERVGRGCTGGPEATLSLSLPRPGWHAPGAQPKHAGRVEKYPIGQS